MSLPGTASPSHESAPADVEMGDGSLVPDSLPETPSEDIEMSAER